MLTLPCQNMMRQQRIHSIVITSLLKYETGGETHHIDGADRKKSRTLVTGICHNLSRWHLRQGMSRVFATSTMVAELKLKYRRLIDSPARGAAKETSAKIKQTSMKIDTRPRLRTFDVKSCNKNTVWMLFDTPIELETIFVFNLNSVKLVK